MKSIDTYSRWKILKNPNAILTTEFRDKNGKLIRTDDTIEYVRKKKTGYGKNTVPAGTVIRARVKEIIVRIKRYRSDVWVLRAINVVSTRGGQAYRIYDTSLVTNTTPPPIKKSSIAEIVQVTESKDAPKRNDDVFSIGLTTI